MATSGLDKLLGRDMPEIAYLKQTNISQILSKGLAETFRVKPNDPKTYFAKFLLNIAHEKEIETLVSSLILIYKNYTIESSYILAND